MGDNTNIDILTPELGDNSILTQNITVPLNQDNSLDTKWGSFHCDKFKRGRKCDLCSHMIEKDHVQSFHFGIPSKIHGYLSHDKIPDGALRWFIYSIEDMPCHKRIVRSTTNPTNRWSTHKSSCNSEKSNSTGLSKHFKQGCPNDIGRDKGTLDFTLIDFYDTTEGKLRNATCSWPKM